MMCYLISRSLQFLLIYIETTKTLTDTQFQICFLVSIYMMHEVFCLKKTCCFCVVLKYAFTE